MARKAIALTVGLNELDPNAYPGVDSLRGCEDDAASMAELAEAAGFEVRPTLFSSAATRGGFIEGVMEAASTLTSPGDILLLYYAGHGSQWEDDPTGDPMGDEGDGLDETLCLYDAQMPDDELLRLWSHFRPGVRVLFLADCCHGGSLVRGVGRTRSPLDAVARRSAPTREVLRGELAEVEQTRGVNGGGSLRARILDRDAAARSFDAMADFYQGLRTQLRADLASGTQPRLDDLGCAVLTITACADDETAKEEGSRGVFTRALIDVWSNGGFAGQNYADLTEAIRERIQSRYGQSPSLLGGGGDLESFLRQRPFEI